MGEQLCVVFLLMHFYYMQLFLLSDVVSSQEHKRMVTLRKMEYEKSSVTFSGCFTQSEDAHARTEREKQEDKKTVPFLCTYPQ